MALQKEIELDNGIKVNYHRIVSINKITNKENVIEIGSYINGDKRKEEIDWYKKEDKAQPLNVFISTTYVSKEYVEGETIQDAYDYLKTLDKFKNAEDV